MRRERGHQSEVFVWVDVNVCIYACVGMCLQKFLWLCRISNIVMHV